MSDQRQLPGFRGDLSWLHAREGHMGRPYWPDTPGGVSGVTLDPGLDLGHATPALIEAVVRPILPAEDWPAIRAVIGLRGEAARKALASSGALRAIRISRGLAASLLPAVAAPYWRRIVSRFPRLIEETTPGQVQTALLSLAYNRGAINRGLEILRQPIAAADWRRVGTLIREMQQDHHLEGIRNRRKLEGNLILDALRPEGGE